MKVIVENVCCTISSAGDSVFKCHRRCRLRLPKRPLQAGFIATRSIRALPCGRTGRCKIVGYSIEALPYKSVTVITRETRIGNSVR